MTLLFIEGNAGTTHYVALAEASSQWAFGPLFHSYRDAQAFVTYCPDDPTTYRTQQLSQLHQEWTDAGKPSIRDSSLPAHICDDECDLDPGSCDVFRTMVGYPPLKN